MAMRVLCLLSLCALVLAGCTNPMDKHCVLGEWLADNHSLRFYKDGTASFDGAAASWSSLGELAVRIDLLAREEHYIWEFTFQCHSEADTTSHEDGAGIHWIRSKPDDTGVLHMGLRTITFIRRGQ